MTEVEKIINLQATNEYFQALNNLDHMEGSAKQMINDALKKELLEKRAALGKLWQVAGNEEAMFYIASIFLFDMKRIHSAGTIQEKIESATLGFQTSDRGTVMGYVEIIKYFLNR